jgi:hypothetical protein
MSTKRAATAAIACTFAVALSSPAAADERSDGSEILTVQHAVPHVSSVPANEGEEVVLYVR